MSNPTMIEPGPVPGAIGMLPQRAGSPARVVAGIGDPQHDPTDTLLSYRQPSG
jgi:hypothetical protein